MGETKGACVSRCPILLRTGYHICRDAAKMLCNFANFSVKIYIMILDLEKEFWLVRSVPGKQGPAWDKTLSLNL